MLRLYDVTSAQLTEREALQTASCLGFLEYISDLAYLISRLLVNYRCHQPRQTCRMYIYTMPLFAAPIISALSSSQLSQMPACPAVPLAPLHSPDRDEHSEGSVW